MKRTFPDSAYADYQRTAEPGDVWLVWRRYGASSALSAVCVDEVTCDRQVAEEIRWHEQCHGETQWSQALGRREVKTTASSYYVEIWWEPQPVLTEPKAWS
jgi:hypothetical protein